MAKIPRKTQKVFASTAGGTGTTEFGSTAAASTNFTTDLDVIQSAAYLGGWLSATVAGVKRLPTYQDMNSLQFLQTTQLSYLFQEGIAEFDLGTTYFIKSVVKRVGTFEIYGSLIDTNLGNALPIQTTDANWQYLGDLADLVNIAPGAAPVPTGTVSHFSFSTAPSGWLECDGSAISRTTFSDLFAVIGTTYGIGDGSTTFNIPDLRGEFLRGFDNGRGVDTGRAFASFQDHALQDMTGSIGSFRTQGNLQVTSGVFTGSNVGGDNAGDGDDGNTFNINFDASNVAQTATETRPRNIAMIGIIKF